MSDWSRPPEQTRSRLVSLLARASLLVLSGIAPIACMTPDFQFGQDPDDRDDGPGGGMGGEGGSESPHCRNRATDADESDVDCGGLDCEPCALGRSCDTGGDCVNGTCTSGKCQDPSCTDRVKNSDETDVDCGGDGCGPCDTGGACEGGGDCSSGICKSGACAAPSCTDRVKNGTEVSVDCGGDCQACEVGQDCVLDEDCRAPTMDAPGTASCEDGVCALLCPTGLGDCNERASDGCETNVLSDMAHCGECGSSCAPDNAVGLCTGGNCLIKTDEPNGGCLGTYSDCNDSPTDGCEINISSDADHCGACDAACSTNNGTPSCASGACSIDCTTGFDDCNSDVDDGCEANLDTSVLHCTGCDLACEPPLGQSAACDGTECVYTTCSAPSDCGGVQPCGACGSDQACNDVLTSTTNCGGCGITCSVANGTPTCQDQGGGIRACAVGACTTNATQTFADCDDNYLNGCEVDVESNRFKCGGCLGSDANPGAGTNCATKIGADHVAAVNCDGGDCKVTGCDTGYADCDGLFSNGCEANLETSGTHCGGCSSGPTTTWDGGLVCNSQFANGTGTCSAGQCEFAACNTDYGDCNGDADLATNGDGCETYTRMNDEDCGGCGIACITDARTSGNACTASSGRACAPTCSNTTNYGNCDANGANGCETTLTSSATNCGTCGNNCQSSIGSNSIATVSCQSGNCDVASCSAGRADCNNTFSDGCEVNTTSSSTHCGGCNASATNPGSGVNCSSSVGSNNIATVSCTSSACDVASCSGSFRDCDNSFANGCEVNTSSNATRCGGCLSSDATPGSGVTCATKANATASCSSSTCAWTCQAGWKDANGDLASPSSNGCEKAIIAIVNSSTTATGSSSGNLTFTHNLQTARAANNRRAVVLLIGNRSNNVGFPPPVTYAGTSMTLANARYENQSYAAIYYILDAALPSGATSATVFIDGDQFNTMRWTANVVELTNVDQSAPVGATVTQGQGGSACNGDLTVATNADAWVISLLNTAGDDTFAALSGQTLLSELLFDGANTIAGYFLEVPAGTRRVQWSCSDSEWTHVVAAFNPEGTD